MATTTINTTGAEDVRIAPAMGDFLHLGQNATQAQVKAAMVAWLTAIVQAYEYKVAQQAIVTTLISPT
jgi:hypothetical protein